MLVSFNNNVKYIIREFVAEKIYLNAKYIL